MNEAGAWVTSQPRRFELLGGMRCEVHEPHCPYERLRAQIGGSPEAALLLPSSWTATIAGFDP